MEKLKIYNGFGITPSKNYTAAGYDFHVPYITDESKFDIVFNAFMKSYKKTAEELNEIIDMLGLYIQSTFDKYDFNKVNAINILHLYLALTPPDDVYDNEEPERQTLSDSIDEFVSYRLIFDDNGVPGIAVFAGDYLLFNSGIKVGLPTDTAGIFFNKSGKGNKGFDTRACVVDEDYSGYVHLSSAFDKEMYFGENIYCGDKFSQMVVLPVVKTEIEEMSSTDYENLMANSQRGADGFGSSDVKH